LNLLLIAALLTSSPLVLAQQKLDIVQIMGQFVQANYAASQCLKPDQQTISRFQSNFRIVTIRATEEMLKRKPDSSEQQVAEQFRKGTDVVKNKIDEVIRKNGCSDPAIQDLLKRFEIQANLKL
jgi:hypothetical protein